MRTNGRITIVRHLHAYDQKERFVFVDPERPHLRGGWDSALLRERVRCD